METAEMGRVITEATVENIKDLWAVKENRRTVDQVRSVTIPDALVDTGATLLSLPTSIVRRLGLEKQNEKRVITSAGPTTAALYDAVRLTIQGRFCTMDVLEVPDGVLALIGQIPLEHLDFVVDPRNQKLIGNPAHGGEHVYEQF